MFTTGGTPPNAPNERILSASAGLIVLLTPAFRATSSMMRS
jgi:hypothetical protein